MHPCLYPGCQRSFPFRMNVGRHMRFHHASGVGRPPSPAASSSPSSPPSVPELSTPPGAPPSRENTPPHDLPLGPGVDDLLELDEDLFLRDDDLDTDYGSEARSSDVGDATDLGEVEELFNFEDEDEPAKLLPGNAGDTLCGQVLKHFAELDDATRGKPVYDAAQRMEAGLGFDNPSLRRGFKHVCTSGGAGLSRIQTKELYELVVTVESATGVERPPFTTRFPSLHSFWMAVRLEKRRLLCRLGWKTAELPISGRMYKVIYRDGLDTIQYQLRRALTVPWERDGPFCSCDAQESMVPGAGGEGEEPEDMDTVLDDSVSDSGLACAARIAAQCANDVRNACGHGVAPRVGRPTRPCTCGLPRRPVRTGGNEHHDRVLHDIFDGESFRAQRDDVRRMFGDNVRMLGLYLYSDGTTLSSSGGTG